ncbi:MAG: recombinase family protein [Dehalococcoidia bacterium]|nr:recombinase family protein [Dehalococcoidia bacterium]
MDRGEAVNQQVPGGSGEGSPWGVRKDLAGKRYVNLLRCSDPRQADTSPEGQKRINDAFGAMNRMTWVQDVYAEGVSGSQTFNREDLQELLDLNRTTPYEVVLVHDLSRLTRGGIRHGNVAEDSLRKAGIRLVSSTDFIPDGPEGDLIKSVKHYANQLQARSISLAVARGLSQSLSANARPAAGRNPYGLDRLYTGADGKRRMLVRWNGRVQVWLKPDTFEKVGERVRPTPVDRTKRQRGARRGPRFKGYTKQTDETSQLVPGAEDRLGTLRWMFEAYDVHRWGYHRIAQHLNFDRKTPGPEGQTWTLNTVKSILFNPIYLGVEIRHRWTGALYNKIGTNGPSPVFLDQDRLEKEKRRRVPLVERPRDEWRLVDVPDLKDLLPAPVRELAAARIMRRFDPNTPPHPRKGKPLHTGEARHP